MLLCSQVKFATLCRTFVTQTTDLLHIAEVCRRPKVGMVK
jgi:hypothetical protein